MSKSKRVGKQIGDYKVLEKLAKNKRSCYIVQCTVCGHVKETYNIGERYMNHSPVSCKEDYYSDMLGNQIGDFKIINIYVDRRAYVDLECMICGSKRIKVAIKDLVNFKNKHDKHCTIRNTEKYDKDIVNKLLRTYNNCKTRIKKGNSGEKKYITYANKEFGFTDSVDFIEYCYPIIKRALRYNNLKDLSIERIDVNLGYVKGNIDFITINEQQYNKSVSYRYVVDNIGFKSQEEVAEYVGSYQQEISREFQEHDVISINGFKIERFRLY